MKKFVIATFLVLALTASAFAASFADVPSSHWAYEAVNKLVASGILSGYPDGTFKGQNNLSRYEIAVVVARVLDQIEAEQAALADGIADADSLSVGQAQQVNEIVKAIVAKNTGEELSDEQANEVRSIVQALTFEFRPELKEIGAAVDALAVDVDELDSRVAALEAQPRDNVSITGTVNNIFETADYGDKDVDAFATAIVWADDDALDEQDDDDDLTGVIDSDDMPAAKAFYQEIDLNIGANVDDISFNLAVDTISNLFSETDTAFAGYKLGQATNESDFKMDTGLLTISKDAYAFKAGDFEDYDIDPYFIDDEDMEGIEINAPLADLDFKVFAVGEDENDGEDLEGDYYGVTVTNEWDNAKLTGKLYHASLEDTGDDDNTVTDFAIAAEGKVTDALTLGGEVVFNQNNGYDADGNEADEDDTLFNVNASYLLTDVVTLRGLVESVGEDFNCVDTVLSDLEEDNNYDKFNLGADFVLNANNTLSADYTLVDSDYDDDKEDKNVFGVGLENTTGKFTNSASIEFTQHDEYVDDSDVTVLKLGTDYAMSDVTTIGADLVYKSAEDYRVDFNGVEEKFKDLKYTYLVFNIDHQLSDNISWLNEVQLINGDLDDVAESYDVEGNSFKSQLSVSF
ncbi:S-layer homology domain-containing protein [Iocasia frigidifontis]|uniref:S-layer homology domain-containing protein n=1 Tax=Iocasia fonsfrigidae TaxID=2682810 RepID=A0A8A7KCA6_9FIRM|nr:S-layer homology domain-containing protein [Iocasia fonsfrigidae]QTL97218.1 S-layer homology domain-containing protein [Iocasia fonsfrigidae]